MKNSLISLFIALWALTPNTVLAEDLLAVIELAHNNDPAYLAARAKHNAALQKLPQARALLLPTLNATGNYTRSNDETIEDPGGADENTLRDSRYTSRGYSFNFTQPLYNSASFAAFKQAKATVRKASADIAAAEQDLYIRGAETYFLMLRAGDNLTLAIAERTAIQRQLELANARLDVGLATITEVHEAKARFESAEAQVIDAQNQLEDARQAMRELTGKSIDQIQQLKPVKDIRESMSTTYPDPADINYWEKLTLEQNYSLLSSQASTDIARDEIKRQRAGHLPTLDLVGTSSRRESEAGNTVFTPDQDTRADSDSYGVQLTVPLVQGGLINAQTKEAKYLYEASKQEYERVRREVVRRARAAYLGVSSAAQRIGALRQAVIAGESALEAKTEGFQAGINTNQDVLDAQRDLFRAKRDYSDSRYTFIINLLQLKQSTGTLAQNDLAEINGWLQ